MRLIQFAFDVRLEVEYVYLHFSGVFADVCNDVGQGIGTINLGLPGSQLIEVRSVEKPRLFLARPLLITDRETTNS